jgi:predicted nucleic acid-binding Zn ribbon protein
MPEQHIQKRIKMPIRTYECKNCEHQEEIYESISIAPKKRKCINCNKIAMRVVILSAPTCQIKEIKTIGQLADSNWKKMGQYEREEKMRQDKVPEALEKREDKIRRNKVAKMTPEQKTRYIETGEMP